MPATLPAEVRHRLFPFEVKALGVNTTDDGQEFGEIEAYGSVFDVVDEGDDDVKPGAFKRTIQASKQRVQSGKASYLAVMLWQHDPACPIGGWFDLKEDDHGLRCKGRIVLSTQLGKECYNLIKAGVIDQFSIGYDIPKGGAIYDPKSGVRNLTEIRLWEVSPVTFAMQPEALLVGVKSMETKSVCGDTSLPIGPRDESWDGSKAKKQIFAYAEKEDGTIDAAKAKRCFLQVDGDTSLKGSYGYPFCYVEGDSPRISVGGVKACAGALSGSRGASTEGGDIAGMRKKVATMYKRINSKYKDDPELTPPWEDDGKAGGRHMQRKTFEEHWNDEMAQDLLEDWCEVWLRSLTCAVFDAFTIGDSPEGDISEAIDAFKESVMSKFVAQAQECNLSEYLSDHAYSYTPGLGAMLNGGGSGYGYMSRSTPMDRKAGRAISAATQEAIDDHVKSLKDMAKKARTDMKAHVKAMHDEIRGVDDEMDSGEKSTANHQIKNAVAQAMQEHADKMHDMADKAMSIMQEHTKAVTTAADDFANTIQGALKPAYGTGEGEAEDDQQEGRGKSQRSPYTRTPALNARPSKKDTALEDVEIPASWLEDIKLRKAV